MLSGDNNITKDGMTALAGCASNTQVKAINLSRNAIDVNCQEKFKHKYGNVLQFYENNNSYE